MVLQNIINGLGSGVQLSGAVVSGELVPNERRFLTYAIVTCIFAPLTSIGPGIGMLSIHPAQVFKSLIFCPQQGPYVLILRRAGDGYTISLP